MGYHASPVERTGPYILCPSTSEASLDPRSSRMDAFPEPAGVVEVAVARRPGDQSELEQALERRELPESPVVPKGELVDVGLKVVPLHTQAPSSGKSRWNSGNERGYGSAIMPIDTTSCDLFTQPEKHVVGKGQG